MRIRLYFYYIVQRSLTSPRRTVCKPHSIHLSLHNGLQLPSIPKRVLDNYLAGLLDLATLLVGIGGCSVGEVNVAVTNDPAAVVGELDDVAFRVEEEEGLGGADGETGVCALTAAGDFRADLVLEDL